MIGRTSEHIIQSVPESYKIAQLLWILYVSNNDDDMTAGRNIHDTRAAYQMACLHLDWIRDRDWDENPPEARKQNLSVNLGCVFADVRLGSFSRQNTQRTTTTTKNRWRTCIKRNFCKANNEKCMCFFILIPVAQQQTKKKKRLTKVNQFFFLLSFWLENAARLHFRNFFLGVGPIHGIFSCFHINIEIRFWNSEFVWWWRNERRRRTRVDHASTLSHSRLALPRHTTHTLCLTALRLITRATAFLQLYSCAVEIYSFTTN